VVQISDGAVQTAGVTVRVKPIGVAEADGGGNTAYSTDGVVLYTPTQAETNYTSFVLIAKKTGCIPASVTVVTSASNTTGYAGTDHSKILNPTSTVNLSGTTIKTATDVETDTQDIQSRLPSSLVDGRIAANAEVVGDKTGYKLASDGLSLVTAWAVAITGTITGNLDGNVLGEVAELGPNALSANSLTDEISLAVWNALTTATYVDQSFGDRVLISANNTRQVAVNGNGHVAGVLHDAEPNSIPEDAFVSGAVSARVIATDAITSDKLAADSITSTQLATTAVTEIKDAIATITPIADLATMITNDGTANARYTVSALQNGPSGEGSTINVYPVSASTPERVAGTTLTFYKNENRSVSVVTDFTLTSLTLQFVVEDAEGNDILTIADGSISRSSQTFTVTIGTTVTGTITNYKWSLRDITSGNSVLARGVLSVQDAAAADA